MCPTELLRQVKSCLHRMCMRCTLGSGMLCNSCKFTQLQHRENLARCVVASKCNRHLNLGGTLLCTCCRHGHRLKALQASSLQLQANCHKMPQHPFRSGKSTAAILLYFAWWLHACSCHSCLWSHACCCSSYFMAACMLLSFTQCHEAVML